MPGKNDYVHYGAYGVCRVEDLRSMRFGPGEPLREYYVLRSVDQHGADIYVPADNPALTARMRPVLSREEIDHLLAGCREERLPWVEDRRQRLDAFRDILCRGDERELLLLARCLYQKSRETAKGLSSTDAQILKKAESMIAQAFSFSLHIGTQQVGGYIRRKLGLTADPSAPARQQRSE